MKCRKVSDLASWYAAGELPPAKMSEVEAHLAECKTCRAEVEAIRRTMRALEEPKRTFEAPDVLAAVKREAASKGTPFLRPAFKWSLAAIGTAAVILGAWLAVGTKSPKPVPGHRMVVKKQVLPPKRDAVHRDKVPSPRLDIPERVEVALSDTREAPRIPIKSSAPTRIRKHYRKHLVPRKPEPAVVKKEQSPKVEYLVAYKPEPSSTESGLEADPMSGVPAAPVVSTYAIRMVDEASGTETNLVVRQEIGHDAVESSSLDYTIEQLKTHGDDERSYHYEDPADHTDPADTVVS